jgi:NAD(P)-dependent dehydrogenase (short-subunit alcohol dehydrogenase family)
MVPVSTERSSTSPRFPDSCTQSDDGHYAASKAGVNNLSRVMALALGEHGINVNVVAPGVIHTEMGLSFGRPSSWRPTTICTSSRSAPRRRRQDIANVVLFLASDESSFMTGQVLVSDGGVKDGLLRARRGPVPN